jgi:hypothetical protein
MRANGEPRGLTGVHEFGVWGPNEIPLDDAGLLPTLAFQDGTLESERGAIERLLGRIAARA